MTEDKKEPVEETVAGTEMTDTDAKHEAPAKEELTQEEQYQRLRMMIAQQLVDKEKELSEGIEELEKLGYRDHTYTEDGGMVEIPGNFFGQLLNFMVTVRIHNDNMKQLFANIMGSYDDIDLQAVVFQKEMLEIHKKACESGVAISREEYEKRNAKKTVQEIVPEKKKKKGSNKARGSK